MDRVLLNRLNSVYFGVYTDNCILAEMSDFFSFKVPNAKFHPKFRARIWDGKIHLLNRINNTIYCGLIEHIKKFCHDRGYKLEYDKEILSHNVDINDYITKQKLPLDIRDYQYNCVEYGIKNHRALFVSPTGSGKSLVIYLLTKYFLDNYDKNILIIVPTLNLISQMYTDFIQYSNNIKVEDNFDIESFMHKIYSGQDKSLDKRIVISTWQSLSLPKNFFEQFGFVLVDEAHHAKANSIKTILSKCTDSDWRFGTTGTLDDCKCNSLVIEGLTGPVFRATTTKQLMDEKKLAKLKINCVVIKYPDEDCKIVKKMKYPDEMDFIISNEKRNKFITNLSISQKGNTLVLFQYVTKHGEFLFKMMREKITKSGDNNRKIFFVYGGTEMKDREMVRSITESEDNAIIIASIGTFSTGINIKNLDNIIFASPSKSRIRTLQSIGRVLRIGKSDKAVLYDIIDDFQYKKHKNFVLKHFIERVKIYDSENFDYNIYQISL